MFSLDNKTTRTSLSLAMVGNQLRVVCNQPSNGLQLSNYYNVGSDYKSIQPKVTGCHQYGNTASQVHCNILNTLKQQRLSNHSTKASQKSYSSLKIVGHTLADSTSRFHCSVADNVVDDNSSQFFQSSLSCNQTIQSKMDRARIVSDFTARGNQRDEIRNREFESHRTHLSPEKDDSDRNIGSRKKFPFKLWEIVNDPLVDGIRWDETGSMVVIHLVKFVGTFLPSQVFATSHFSSFIRQLNIYGFRKVRECEIEENQKIGVYQHKNFIRGHFSLVRLVKRTCNKPANIPRIPGKYRKSKIRVKDGDSVDDGRLSQLNQFHELLNQNLKESVNPPRSSSPGVSNDSSDDEYVDEKPLEGDQCMPTARINSGSSMVKRPRSHARLMNITVQQQIKLNRRWEQFLSEFEDVIVEGMAKEEETIKFINSLI